MLKKILAGLVIATAFVVSGFQQNTGGGGGTGGGGSGTVSANNIAAGAVGVYAAAGGSTTIGPSTLNYVQPTLTVSSATNGNGAIALSGTTSGTGTCTVSATGTGWICTGAGGSYGLILGTAGTGSGTLTLAGSAASNNTLTMSAGTGVTGQYLTICFDTSNCSSNPQAAISGTNILGGGPTMAFSALSTGAFMWSSSSTTAQGTPDTILSRPVAGLVSVASTTAGNELGLLRSGNTCSISADIALTVNTATNVCSFALPALAKVWAIHCNLPWTITAGTGTNTMSVGVNASQTPTTTTNITGWVWNGTTPGFAATALSASGALNIFTGTTFTPVATIQAATLDGTVAASATAGTFAITMTAAGTTATAAAKSGAYCRLE